MTPTLLVGTPDEARAAVAALLRDGLTPEVVGTVARMGLVGEALGGGRVALREAAAEPLGLGEFLVRRGGRALLLQAPHRETDLDTGRLVALMAEEGRLAAAAWNSVPRSVQRDGERVDADLAAAPVSLFNAFTMAFAEAHPGGVVAQVHGFAQEKRRDERARSADVIVSSGTREPSALARRVTDCLAAALHEAQVRLYPEQVRELGAEASAQGRALRAVGFEGFFHVELARKVRRQLVRSRAKRDALTGCLLPA